MQKSRFQCYKRWKKNNIFNCIRITRKYYYCNIIPKDLITHTHTRDEKIFFLVKPQ